MTSQLSAYSARMLDAARVCLLVTAASLALSTAATNTFAVLAFLCWALSGRWTPAFRAIGEEPTAWLGCALFAALALGIAWSMVPPREAAGALLKYRGLLLFGITMYLFSDARWRERLLAAFCIGTLALLTVSYAMWVGLLPYVRTVGYWSATNAVVLKNAITHGFLVSLLAYGAAVFALHSRGRRRWFFATTALLAVLNVWFAVQGRTGYVVLAVLILWLAASQRSIKLIAVVLLCLAATLAAGYRWSPAFQARIDQTATEAVQERVAREASIPARLHYAKRSLGLIGKHPILGAGTGSWGEAFYEATAGDSPIYHDRRNDHPHNEFLHLGVQLGVGGLALLVALFAVAFWRAGMFAEREALLARGFVLAFAVGCLFNDFLRDSTEAHLWAVLGGALFGASAQRPRMPLRP